MAGPVPADANPAPISSIKSRPEKALHYILLQHRRPPPRSGLVDYARLTGRISSCMFCLCAYASARKRHHLMNARIKTAVRVSTKNVVAARHLLSPAQQYFPRRRLRRRLLADPPGCIDDCRQAGQVIGFVKARCGSSFDS